uniref:PDZ GRASP-type domain-containing protein n=1 Tax=Chaetoceros debilis TaxID=122233 RepID=A0A6S8RPB4_9STRA
MGNAPSQDDHQYDGCTTLGYRVLGVQPDSPASRAGLVSFFDFLVGVNGQLLFDNGANVGEHDNGEFFEDLDFVAILKDNVDQEVELLVWNIKSQTQRFINLTPTTNWPGTGLLGVTIRMDDYATAEEKLLRILDIAPKSPAAISGLTPNTDYLLGTTMESFEDEELLGDVLYENEDGVLEVYVYNTESDVVRVVTLMPNKNWGGNGLLGAEVGRGYLHRLPKMCRDTLGVSFERNVSAMDQKDGLVVNAVEDIKKTTNVLAEGNVNSNSNNVGHASENSVDRAIPNTKLNEDNNTDSTVRTDAPQVMEPAVEMNIAASPAAASKPALELEPIPIAGVASPDGSGMESLSLGDDLPPPPIVSMLDEEPEENATDLR